jgi:hypothetical protein
MKWVATALLAPMAIGSLALAQGGGGAGAPASNVDWWARGFSALAIVISLAAFAAGRLDKWREKKAAAAAKLPVVDVHVENADIAGDWYFQIKTTNRADVSIEFISIDASCDFELSSDDAKTKERAQKIMIDRLKIEPGGDDMVDGEIHGRFTGHQKIEFTLEYRIFEPVPRTITRKVTRDL